MIANSIISIKNNKVDFRFVFLYIFAGFPFFPPAIQTISFVFFCISILYFNRSHFNVKTIEKKDILFIFILTSYYWFNLCTILWSEKCTNFLIEVQPSIGLLILPTLVLFFKFKIPKKHVQSSLLVFVLAFLGYLILWYNYIVKGIEIFQITNYGNYDFVSLNFFQKFKFLIIEFINEGKSYSQLGMDGYYYFAKELNQDFFVHHAYTSAYALICIIILLDRIDLAKKSINLLYSILIIIFIFYILYVDSQVNKALLALIPFYLVIKFKKNKWNNFIISLYVFIIILVSILKYDYIKSKLDNFVSYTESNSEDNIGIDNLRYKIYSKSIELFKENFWVGTGLADVKIELNNKLTNQTEIQYNTHSQFMHYALGGGIINLFLFLLFFGYLSYLTIKSKNIFLLFFIIVLFSNCLFENFLSRIWGVFLMNLYLILFLNRLKSKKR